MGNLAIDTQAQPAGPGRFSARLSRDWEIWGPMGGYVAAIALRAAGAASPFRFPASFFCHYLGVADFDQVDIEVVTLRAGRSAMSQRVIVNQGERAVLEATVWSFDPIEGLEHDTSRPPEVPDPDSLLSREQLNPGISTFTFWDNVEMRPVSPYMHKPDGPLPPEWQAWCRFRPQATFDDDPWLDACRALIVMDVQSWPAASRPHIHREPHGFIAPSLDLYVAFHGQATGEPWLLADGVAPASARGILGWTGRIWTVGGGLVASGGGQALYRQVGPERA